jgi:hypothetical protein
MIKFLVIVFYAKFISASVRLEIENNFMINNVYVGTEPGIKISPILTFSRDIKLQINTSSNSRSMQKDAAGILFDYIHINRIDSFFGAYLESNMSLISLGWFASKTGCGATYADRALYHCVGNKKLIAPGIELGDYEDEKLCTRNLSFIAANKSILSWPVCLVPGGSNIYLPASYGAIDHTASVCISILELSDKPICSGISTHEKNYIMIGTHAVLISISQFENVQMAWKTWDERLDYATLDKLILFTLIVFLLYWTLFYCHTMDIESIAFCTKESKKARPFVIGIIVTLVFIILHEIIQKNVHKRITYVVNDTFTNEFDIYIAFCGIAILFTIILCLKSTISSNPTLQQSCFETLLSAAVVSTLVGRTVVTEESLLCFITAVIWTYAQLLCLNRAVGWVRNTQLALFVILYPFVVIVFIEPVVRLFPNMQRNSFITSQILITTPIVLLTGYRGIFPNMSE